MRALIVGHGAREAALGSRMARHGPLHAFMGHANPSLMRAAARSGGDVRLGDVCDGDSIVRYARAARVELAMVSSDEPLAAGVVDALARGGVPAVGATRSAAEIEWSKVFAREVLFDLEPDACPRFQVVREPSDVEPALRALSAVSVVVKPAGLSGGKGVKVMGEHLGSRKEAAEYARALLARGEVVIEERLEGPEFTIQGVTDGRTVVCPPATYDYPFRFDGDRGPGTGGMGSFSAPSDELPFITPAEYRRACEIVRKVVARLEALGRPFQGVLNAGFFATGDGVKVTELNARFGDPECMNILALASTSWVDAMRAIVERRLGSHDLRLRREASVVVYLVPPHYALGGDGASCEFTIDVAAVEAEGCEVHFASCEHVSGDEYRTLGRSRALAVAATGASIDAAGRTVTRAIERHLEGPLEWRRDIASGDYVRALVQRMG